MEKKKNGNGKISFGDTVKIIIFYLILFGFFWIIGQKMPPPGMEEGKSYENTYLAKDLIIIFEADPCDSAYLGTWDVENFGKMELFCENGQYYGEISPYFSISMKELSQRGYFLAVFCMYNTCYSHPIVIEGDSMHDVYGEYMEATR